MASAADRNSAILRQPTAAKKHGLYRGRFEISACSFNPKPEAYAVAENAHASGLRLNEDTINRRLHNDFPKDHAQATEAKADDVFPEGNPPAGPQSLLYERANPMRRQVIRLTSVLLILATSQIVRPVEAQQSTVDLRELRNKAFDAEKAGDIAEATAAYKLLVEKSPDDRALYARFLAKQGKIDEAIEQYRAYYADNPQHHHVLAEISKLYAEDGRIAEAIKSREAYMAGTPSVEPESRRQLLELWGKSGNLEKAAEHYRAITEDNKAESQKIVLARLMLVELATRDHDTVEARKQYWLALDEVFPAKDSWARRVFRVVLNEFLVLGWLDDAVQAYRRHPMPPLLSRLGGQLKREGRGYEMLALYREHLLMRPVEYSDYAREGAFYGPLGFARQLINEIASVGQCASVVESLRARVAEDPKSVTSHKNLGYLLYKMKRYQPALSEFDEVVRLSDKPSDTFYEWCGRLCADANLVDEAINYYEKARDTELTPEDLHLAFADHAVIRSEEQMEAYFKARVLEALGELYKQKKQLADAERCYLAVVDLKPHARMKQRAEAALAEVWKTLDKENAFLEELKGRVAKSPDDASLRREYAKALHTAGDLRPAIEQYTQAVELSPDDLEIRLELARASGKAGDHDQAVEQYETVLDGSIRNPPRPTRGGSQATPEYVLRELSKFYHQTDRQVKLLSVYETILKPKTPEVKWTPSEHTLTTILRDMTKILASRAAFQAVVDLWITHHEQMEYHARSAIREHAPRLDSLEPLIGRLQEMSRNNRNDFWARLILGDVLMLDNKRPQAMAVYIRLSADADDERRIHRELAEVYQRMQRYDLAIEEHEQILRYHKRGDQDYVHTLKQIAQLHVWKGDKTAAAELYRELIRYEPRNIEHYRSLHEAVDGKEGIIEKPPAPIQEPLQAAAQRAKADQLAAEGRFVDAIATYKEILAKRSTDIGAMVALARAYQGAGQQVQAVATLEKAHAMRKWTDRNYGVGQELERIYGEMKADDKLVALYTERKDYSSLRRLYHNRKQPEKFQAFLRTQLEEIPHDRRVRLYLGQSYLESDNLVAAREVYEGLHRDLGTDEAPDKSLAVTVSTGFERLGEPRKALRIMESIDYENDPDSNDWLGELLMRLYAKDDQFAKALEICVLRLKKDADGHRTVAIAQEIAGFAAARTDGTELLDAFLRNIKGEIPGRNYNRFLGSVRAYRSAHPTTPDDDAKPPSPTEDVLSLLKEGRIVRTPRSTRNLEDFLDQLATQAHTTFTQSYRHRARQLPAPNIQRSEGPAFELLAKSIDGKPATLEINQEGHWALFEHGDLNKKSIYAAHGGIICKISNGAVYRHQNGYLGTLGRMMFEPLVGRNVLAVQSQVKVLEVIDDQGRSIPASEVKKPRWSPTGQLSFHLGKQDRPAETLAKVRVETAVAVCTRWTTLRAPRLDHTKPISLENDGITVTIEPLEVVQRGGQDTWQLPMCIRRSLGPDAENVSMARHEMHFVTADGKRQEYRGSGANHSANYAEIRARAAVDAFNPATTSLVLREPAAIEIVPVTLTFRDIPIVDR